MTVPKHNRFIPLYVKEEGVYDQGEVFQVRGHTKYAMMEKRKVY